MIIIIMSLSLGGVYIQLFLLLLPTSVVLVQSGDSENEGKTAGNATPEDRIARWGMSQEDYDLVIERLKLLTKLHREANEQIPSFHGDGNATTGGDSVSETLSSKLMCSESICRSGN